jgi:hypothetical protein
MKSFQKRGQAIGADSEECRSNPLKNGIRGALDHTTEVITVLPDQRLGVGGRKRRKPTPSLGDKCELIVAGGRIVPAVKNMGCEESLLPLAALLHGARMGVAGLQIEARDRYSPRKDKERHGDDILLCQERHIGISQFEFLMLEAHQVLRIFFLSFANCSGGGYASCQGTVLVA